MYKPHVLLVVQTGSVVNGAVGIDRACHYLSLGISQSAQSPSEALHQIQHAYLWARVMAPRGERERVAEGERKKNESKRESDSWID